MASSSERGSEEDSQGSSESLVEKHISSGDLTNSMYVSEHDKLQIMNFGGFVYFQDSSLIAGVGMGGWGSDSQPKPLTQSQVLALALAS